MRSFPWYSSGGGDFNFDFQASFTPEQLAAGEAFYNFESRKNSMSDLVGISVFFKDEDGAVYHTYSCYSRGVEIVNGAYHFLDLTPLGRQYLSPDDRSSFYHSYGRQISVGVRYSY